MKVLSKLAKTKYDHNRDNETHLLVELSAPKVEWKKDRAPICVVPVLDVSGSMYGTKIDYLQKACRKFIDHLSPGDFLGLVAFDSNVYEVAPIVEITQHQKDRLKEKVSALIAGSCTCTSGGLLKAFSWIKEMDLPKNVIFRVILFTDGMANYGVTGRDLLDFVKENKGKATLSAFGFGNDCDQELLADMTTVGDGNYAFIDSPESALTAFARELGGLMSVYGQEIEVKIVPDKNNSVMEILNDENVKEDNGTAIVQLRDILGEEQKWIVAKVKLNEVEKALPRKVNAFKVCVSYKDKNGKNIKVDPISIKVTFCKPGEESKEEDAEVVRQRDRLLAARAQDQAEAAARAGNFHLAEGIMLTCANSLSDVGVKGLMSSYSANYSAVNYGSTRGASNTLRKSFKGRRISYTSDSSIDISHNAAMDDMIESFKTDDVVDLNITNDTVSNDIITKTGTGEDW